jgi:hypothetical protein
MMSNKANLARASLETHFDAQFIENDGGVDGGG